MHQRCPSRVHAVLLQSARSSARPPLLTHAPMIHSRSRALTFDNAKARLGLAVFDHQVVRSQPKETFALVTTTSHAPTHVTSFIVAHPQRHLLIDVPRPTTEPPYLYGRHARRRESGGNQQTCPHPRRHFSQARSPSRQSTTFPSTARRLTRHQQFGSSQL